MQATASITTTPVPSLTLGCGAVSTLEMFAGVTFTFEVIGGPAEFTWNVSQCVRNNWPPGTNSEADASMWLYQGTDQLAARTCSGATYGASPMTLDPGTYQLRIGASTNIGVPTGALAMISATATVEPT